MVIFGVAILAICTIVGLFLGELLGQLLGVKANVGGVGFGIVLLIAASTWLHKRGRTPLTDYGVNFWNAIYIPIVVAMAAQQNVIGALKGGPAALLAGLLATVACGALIVVFNKLRRTPIVPLPPIKEGELP
ncbi:malonate transporter subunit MadL [Pseudoxanthomonas sp. JBR18]|uniref:malonate transporter subunit MadL n=1 Tax=Pseudoxanthomonas sp. JBR18 TaxID=2969308 RepID=UPI0023052325|nr:malonate transporter subunit MadL [Pseudoxanthomonas sp. JBR18]WCE02729.1 malonate transporter subunit MadL [Pseudoxanthomonas sp. JBR18]